jgi:signal transduction histidine kinase
VTAQRRARAVDVLLAGLAMVVQVVGLRAGRPVQPLLTGVPADLLLAVSMIAQGGSLLMRRSRPVTGLVICQAGYVLNSILVPGVPPYAGWAALYAAGVYPRPARRATFAVLAGTAAFAVVIGIGAVVYRAAVEELVLLLLITVIVALLATVIRSRRARLDALLERAAAVEREREADMARAAMEERLHIAREMHDLVGHGLSSIAVQSSTARVALDAGRPDRAMEALAAVEASSRAALAEMRQLLGLLRGNDADGYRPPPGLGDLPDLVQRLRAQGVAVTLSADALGQVPEAVSLAAYRVVQEALTNAVKHAQGSRVAVNVSASAGALAVEVDDYADRPTPHPKPRPEDRANGRGLVGMRERVAALGGRLEAGPAGDHPGWRVRASIPYPGEDRP